MHALPNDGSHGADAAQNRTSRPRPLPVAHRLAAARDVVSAAVSSLFIEADNCTEEASVIAAKFDK